MFVAMMRDERIGDDRESLVYSYPSGFLSSLEREWGLTEDKLIKLMVVPVPAMIERRVIADKFRKRYRELPEEFQAVDGAIRVSKMDFPNGILVPKTQSGLIVALKVYRHAKDRHSFIL